LEESFGSVESPDFVTSLVLDQVKLSKRLGKKLAEEVNSPNAKL